MKNSLIFLVTLIILVNSYECKTKKSKFDINVTQQVEDIKIDYNSIDFNENQYDAVSLNMETDLKVSASNRVFQQYLQNFRNVQFVGQVAVGSTKQLMKVIFDTGSSVLWFTNSKDPYATRKRHYDCGNKEITTTCKKAQSYSQMRFIQYGSGAVQGRKVSDSLYIPGLNPKAEDKIVSWEKEQESEGNYMGRNDGNLIWGAIRNQDFLEVFKSPGMEIVQADGVLGLGPTELSDMKSVLKTLKEQNIIIEQQFAFLYSSVDNIPSKFTIGGYDKKIVGNKKINWIPKTFGYHWNVNLTALYIDGAKVKSAYNNVMFDTGSSWVILYPMDFMIFFSMAGKKGYSCGTQNSILFCEKEIVSNKKDDFSNLPELRYVIGTETYVLDFNLLKANCKVNFKNGKRYLGCLFKVRSLFLGMRILGMPFLQQNYVIFDRDHLRVGIVPINKGNVKKAGSNPRVWSQKKYQQKKLRPGYRYNEHVTASPDEHSIRRKGPSVFFFFAFLTLTAVLVIIIYFVATKLLDEDDDSSNVGPLTGDNSGRNQEGVELLPRANNTAPQEELSHANNTRPQGELPRANNIRNQNNNDQYNPFNPFNDSMNLSILNQENDNRRYQNIGGGIATADEHQEVNLQQRPILHELNPESVQAVDPFVAYKPQNPEQQQPMGTESNTLTGNQHVQFMPKEQEINNQKNEAENKLQVGPYANEIEELSQIQDASHLKNDETMQKEQSKDILSELDNYNPYEAPKKDEKSIIRNADESYDPYSH